MSTALNEHEREQIYARANDIFEKAKDHQERIRRLESLYEDVKARLGKAAADEAYILARYVIRCRAENKPLSPPPGSNPWSLRNILAEWHKAILTVVAGLILAFLIWYFGLGGGSSGSGSSATSGSGGPGSGTAEGGDGMGTQQATDGSPGEP